MLPSAASDPRIEQDLPVCLASFDNTAESVDYFLT
jgi:hypothetical protein